MLRWVGIGDMSENSYMVDLGWFTAGEMVQVMSFTTRRGGWLLAMTFSTRARQAANTVMSDRVIGLGLEEFRPIAEVITIAAENGKPLALLGALRTGVVDVIATSVSNALTVLNLDEQLSVNKPNGSECKTFIFR